MQINSTNITYAITICNGDISIENTTCEGKVGVFMKPIDMTKTKLILFLIILTFIAGCLTELPPQKQPLGKITPIPPEGVIEEFILYYNERDSKALYNMFSDNVKTNYTLEDVKREVEIAKKHNITIVGWKKVGELFTPPTVILKANLTFNVDGNLTTKIIDFPMVFVEYEVRRNGVYATGSKLLIDEWVFDDFILL